MYILCLGASERIGFMILKPDPLICILVCVVFTCVEGDERVWAEDVRGEVCEGTHHGSPFVRVRDDVTLA